MFCIKQDPLDISLICQKKSNRRHKAAVRRMIWELMRALVGNIYLEFSVTNGTQKAVN